MFYQNFLKLCEKHGVKPNNVTKAIGLSTATATNWKSGCVPRDVTLQRLAGYFGVTVDDLLHDPEPARVIEGPSLSPQKAAWLACFDRVDERDKQVLLMLLDKYLTPEERFALTHPPLGSEQDGKVHLYAAASSTDRHPDGFIYKDKEEWDKLRNAPDTDDSLL